MALTKSPQARTVEQSAAHSSGSTTYLKGGLDFLESVDNHKRRLGPSREGSKRAIKGDGEQPLGVRSYGGIRRLGSVAAETIWGG